MMMMSGNFTPESQMSSCDEPRGIGCWNLWGFMNAHKPLVKKTTQKYRNTGADKSRTEKVLIARAFLESLAKMPSRYCRKDSHKLYLETVITSGTHLNLRCLQYLPDGSVSYKINYTDQWQPLPQRQRKNKADDNTITRMYKAPMRITSTRWQHLQKLKKVLPKDYHHFYDALPHGDWILNTGTSSVLIPRQAPLDIKGTCSAV